MSAPLAAEPLQPYLQAQHKADNELRRVLRAASREADAKIRSITGNRPSAQVRRTQYDLAKSAIEQLTRRTVVRVGDVIAENGSAMVDAGAKSESDILGRHLSKAGATAGQRTALAESMRAQAASGPGNLASRLSSSRIELSTQVYKTSALASGLVERQINISLALGESAKELADRVRGLIDPNVRGGVSYAAQRLGRTELNNAFHAAQIAALQDAPGVVGVKWNLSGSHPKKDKCDLYATEDHVEQGAGVYDTKAVPRKPHPQCLCYCTPVMMDVDDFLRDLVANL